MTKKPFAMIIVALGTVYGKFPPSIIISIGVFILRRKINQRRVRN